MSIEFRAPTEGIVVKLDGTGNYSSTGSVAGISIKSAIPIDQGRKCIVLMNPDANMNNEFRNLKCIDESGAVIWIAKLPSIPDVFLDIETHHGNVLAKTWSGHSILIDAHSGIELRRVFTK
jgi:hypothetical protein